LSANFCNFLVWIQYGSQQTDKSHSVIPARTTVVVTFTCNILAGCFSFARFQRSRERSQRPSRLLAFSSLSDVAQTLTNPSHCRSPSPTLSWSTATISPLPMAVLVVIPFHSQRLEVSSDSNRPFVGIVLDLLPHARRQKTLPRRHFPARPRLIDLSDALPCLESRAFISQHGQVTTW
jgi:hypothetical protein